MENHPSEILDNFALNVRARTSESFRDAMQIAFRKHPTAAYVSEHRRYGLVFFWAVSAHDDHPEFQGVPIRPLKNKMTVETAIEYAWKWLKIMRNKNFNLHDWDAEYQGDAWMEHAWRVYVEDWGHVGDNPYAICAVLPVYAWVGK